MGVVVHRSSDPRHLVGQLCKVISEPVSGVLAPEVVSVPTRGIERWITEQIALRTGPADDSGICANVEFPRPIGLVRDLLRQVPGAAGTLDGWQRGAVVRRTVALLEENGGGPSMWLLDRFIAGSDEGASVGAQRLRAARKIARLFDSYERYRPTVLEAWETGRDLGPDGKPLRESQLWQPLLWRGLIEMTASPPMHRILPEAVEALRHAEDIKVPLRISLYGLTAIDPTVLGVLDAVSSRSDVHLFVLHPSPALWDKVAARVPDASGAMRRGSPEVPDPARHPLLRSWAQESVELQLMLAGLTSDIASPSEGPSPSQTVLGMMQSDVVSDRLPSLSGGLAARVASGEDQSIRIRACHGPQRQVEVMRDAILHAMVEDPTLEPRDIVIMTPDLDTFAPLIETAFPSRVASQGALPDLRVAIADRAPSATNPLVRMAALVVDLATSRLTAGDITSLLAIPEVVRRFRITDDIANEIASLVDDANVRWGLDAQHRAEWFAGERDEHTWRRGIDRLLAGVFYDDSHTRVVGDIAPLNGIEGTAADAAGTLAVVLDAVSHVRTLLAEAGESSTWPSRLFTAVHLLAATGWYDQWQWAQLSRLLDETFASGEDTDPDTVITVTEAAMLIQSWTEHRPSRLHHRTGDLTVCTLPPRRSVPYRLVCLLGLDHDRFPRSRRTDGDDLLADDERVGDRDPGAEDRQLLLDALMAARDRIVITYTGRDPRTNTEYPPAVPVSELLEVVASMIGDDSASSILIHHSLQSFGSEVFTPGKLGIEGSWGFDRMHYEGAVARAARQPKGVVGGAVLVGKAVDPPDLDGLIRFHSSPCATFVDHNFGLRAPRPEDPPDQDLPLDLNGLEKWQVKVDLLDGFGRMSTTEELVLRQRGLDTLPAGELADQMLDTAIEEAVALRDAATRYGCGSSGRRRVAGVADLGAFRLPGRVDVHDDQSVVSDISPSGDKAKRRLALYAKVAWLSVIEPDKEWSGVMIGKGSRKGSVLAVRIGPFGATPDERAERGRDALVALADIMDEAMARPAPIFPNSALAWQTADHKGRRGKVRSPWEGSDFNGIPGERDDEAVKLLFPELITIDDLESSDFAVFAERIWQPILNVCTEDEQ